MQKLTLLESVSSRSSGPSKFRPNFRPDTMYSRTLPLSSADYSSQFWMHAYTVGLSLSYLDNTSATAESYAFLCAAPNTTRGHALYFRPRETEFLLLLGNKEKQRAGTIFHRCILNPSSHPHCHSLEIQLCIKNIFYYYRWLKLVKAVSA